tara:strand:- start:1935 stop:2495 length:561 start_codon:yes stop_codon:yes gene_type:complete
MAKLRPFRQIDELDVVNLFAFNGSTASKGDMVKLHASKVWKLGDELETTSINNSYANTVSDRYSVKGRVDLATSGDTPLGMLMYDVAETDENGEKLIWHPRKAHEMQVSISGQAVPVLTKGIVLVEVESGEDDLLAIAAGTNAYAGDAGAVITATTGRVGNLVKVGKFLGPKDTDNGNQALLKLDL